MRVRSASVIASFTPGVSSVRSPASSWAMTATMVCTPFDVATLTDPGFWPMTAFWSCAGACFSAETGTRPRSPPAGAVSG